MLLMTILKNWLFLTVAVLVTSFALIPGIRMKRVKTAIWVAAVYGVLHALFYQLLMFLTFPVVWLTLGLFKFVLSALLLWLTDKLVDDFEIKNFWWTLAAALLIGLIDGFLHYLF